MRSPAMQSSKILRLPDVLALTGLGRDSIYRLAKRGEFPRPLKLSARASGWVESEVSEFIERRRAARDAA
jgi:prophage regulatory protein